MENKLTNVKASNINSILKENKKMTNYIILLFHKYPKVYVNLNNKSEVQVMRYSVFEHISTINKRCVVVNYSGSPTTETKKQ